MASYKTSVALCDEPTEDPFEQHDPPRPASDRSSSERWRPTGAVARHAHVLATDLAEDERHGSHPSLSLYGELLRRLLLRAEHAGSDRVWPDAARCRRELAAMAGMRSHIQGSPRQGGVSWRERALLAELDEAMDLVVTVLDDDSVELTAGELDLFHSLNTQLLERVFRFAERHDDDSWVF